MRAADVKAGLVASGLDLADDVAISLSQKLSVARIPLTKIHFLSEADIEKLTDVIVERITLREIKAACDGFLGVGRSQTDKSLSLSLSSMRETTATVDNNVGQNGDMFPLSP